MFIKNLGKKPKETYPKHWKRKNYLD